MAGWDDLIEIVYDYLQEQAAIEEAADAGYNLAMDMCGNDGQVSVIDMTGYDAFYEAADAIAQSTGEGYDILVAACPYPEAVSIILQEAAALMIDIINEISGEFLDGLGDDDEGEFEEGEFEGSEGGFFDF